ncbi:MAG: ABC transporter ATP-binding protein, partial [Chitinophagales bacterium]
LYLNMLFRPLRAIADKFNTLQMGLVASDRVFSILDREERIDNTGTQKTTDMQGQITFDKVWFAYDEVNMVLKNVSFDLKQGETLAIVGATGAGKSSIINILNRFYEIQKGSIKIDGIDIRDYDLYELRQSIGLVLQDVFLFSGSITDNVTLRNAKISEAQILQAAKEVGADDFIQNLPNKYDYEVMERGVMLSLGQRQLISFIRALAFDPKILILDEATSSIDTETEILVQNAVERLVADRTSIVIAHRLSTIQHADKIMVLDSGEIVEIGSHEELLALNGHYRQLHDTQFAVEEVV